jgi:hypothetical protein
MLNNVVSPIDHVVMNHKNQTRANGIWGHVRYNYAQLPQRYYWLYGIYYDLYQRYLPQVSHHWPRKLPW